MTSDILKSSYVDKNKGAIVSRGYEITCTRPGCTTTAHLPATNWIAARNLAEQWGWRRIVPNPIYTGPGGYVCPVHALEEPAAGHGA